MTGRRSLAKICAFVGGAIIAVAISTLAAAQSQRGVVLTPLDPAVVDDSSRSIVSGTATILFVNKSGAPVDIYWIDFSGRRVRYTTLANGATYSQQTYLGHPWLVVRSGTGGTAARDSGLRIAGFQAQTPNPANDPSVFDTAFIYPPNDGGATIPNQPRSRLPTLRKNPNTPEPTPPEPTQSAADEGNDVAEPCTNLADHAIDWMFNPPPGWVSVVSPALRDIQKHGLTARIQSQGGVAKLLQSTRRDLANVPAGDAYGINLNNAWISLLVCMSDQQIRAQSPPTEPPAPQNQGAPGDQPLDFLVGQYRREPMLNNWHQGTIQMAAGGQTLVWKNDAGAAWGLTPDLKDGILITDFKENPFYDSQPERGRVFRLRMLPNDAGVDGFEFLGDFYRRVSPQKPVTPYQPTSQHTPGAPTLRHQPNRDTGAEPVTPSAPSESGDTDTAPDTLPVVLTTADPEYTVLARRAQVSGVVWVVVDIDTTGHPVNPHVMRELGFGLDEEAIKAVDKWTFQPATKDGKPVPSKMWIQITFRLP